MGIRAASVPWRQVIRCLWMFALGLAGACDSNDKAPLTGPEPPVPVRLAGSGTDAVGDALADTALAKSPDLLTAELVKENGEARLQVRFADQSYDSANTVVVVLVDADLNAATGVSGSGTGDDEGAHGADYVFFLDLRTPFNSFLLSCAGPVVDDCTGVASTVSRLEATVMGTSGLNATASDVFGARDSPVRFKVGVFALEGISVGGDIFLDYMPDAGVDPIRVE